MPSRAKRLDRLAEILATNQITSQEQLRDLLLADGYEATQATISRDLRELGVIKRESGYAAPANRRDARKAAKEVAAALRGQVKSAQRAGTMVVVHTLPGMGQTIAVALTQADLPACVGAIASHDTVMIATHSGAQARQFAQQIMNWSGVNK